MKALIRMSNDAGANERQYNVLVYGLERKKVPVPPEPIRSRNFTVHFEEYGTYRRFTDYDGVVVFQGLFESFERPRGGYSESRLSHQYDADELDKRKKEALLLTRKGGFICFLLTQAFIDSDHGTSFEGTDLAKYHLNYSHFYRENFQSRVAHVTPLRDEFRTFLERYGAANSHFKNLNEHLDFRPIAEVNGRPVGAIIARLEYFVPSLLPEASPKGVEEYFKLLVDALTSVHNKMPAELPAWAASFAFSEEAALKDERDQLLHEVGRINARLAVLARFKSVLIHSGPDLVLAGRNLLETGLGIGVDSEDNLREDVRLKGSDGTIIAVAEIKGINRGVKREHINQTDSHRERSGFGGSFPALLIANANIKGARSIKEKDEDIATEQVQHAVRMNVLVVRTIDLLGLVRLVLAGRLPTDSARALLLSPGGWLRVRSDTAEVQRE